MDSPLGINLFTSALLVFVALSLVLIASVLAELNLVQKVDDLLRDAVKRAPRADVALRWSGLGTVSPTVFLIVALASFGLSGIFLQSLLGLLFDGLPSSILVAPFSAAIAAFAARGAAKAMTAASQGLEAAPAFNARSLEGREATVIRTDARGQTVASIKDAYGDSREVILEMETGGPEIEPGQVVLLEKHRRGTRFSAVRAPQRLS